MGRRVLRRHIWGYSVCLCPIKRTPGLNELIAMLKGKKESVMLLKMSMVAHLQFLAREQFVFQLPNTWTSNVCRLLCPKSFHWTFLYYPYDWRSSLHLSSMNSVGSETTGKGRDSGPIRVALPKFEILKVELVFNMKRAKHKWQLTL